MNPSFGSGTSLLGASASNVLGMPGGTMQQSPSSAGYQPGTLPPPQGQIPQGPPPGLPQAPQTQSIGAPGPVSQQGVVGTPPGVPETMMILKALIARQQLLGEHEEHVRNSILPPQPQGGI